MFFCYKQKAYGGSVVSLFCFFLTCSQSFLRKRVLVNTDVTVADNMAAATLFYSNEFGQSEGSTVL